LLVRPTLADAGKASGVGRRQLYLPTPLLELTPDAPPPLTEQEREKGKERLEQEQEHQ
jgi:hypothetical protein